MAEIRGFAGLRYDTRRVQLDDVIAPPYDVISPDQKEQLKRRSPLNAVRLILPDDTPQRDRYCQSAYLLDQWRREGVLQKEPREAVYVCRQRFQWEGVTHRRTGFLAAVGLEPFGQGSIFPHEATLSGPKADRMKLLVATRANLSAVFSIFSDPRTEVRDLLSQVVNAPATFSVTEPSGECEVWVVTDPQILQSLSRCMTDKRLFIADGHHRYETALAYTQELRREGKPNPKADFLVMFCVAMEDPGLATLPTHRLVRAGVGPSLNELLRGLGTDFDVKSVSGDPVEHLRGLSGWGAFILYAGKGRAWSMSLREGFDWRGVDPHQSQAWCRLDVAVLQKRVFEPLLNLTLQRITGGSDVGYSHDARQAMDWVDEGRYGMGWLLRPTPVEGVVAVAEKLEKMPPKSTYFYPKVLSGLVFRTLD